MKKLIPKEYCLPIVEDLGSVQVTKTEKRRCAIFMCKCGNTFTSQVRYVKSERRKACTTCSRRAPQVTHGLSKHPIYVSYSGMLRRCYSKSCERYEIYGKRGITVCDEWRDSFETFFLWSMKNGWEKNLTIDRVDSNLGYDANNCRWLDKRSQAQNKRIRPDNTTGYIGVRKRDKKYIASARTWDKKKIHLGTYLTPLEAAKARDSYYVIHGFEEMTLNKVDLFNAFPCPTP